MDDKLDVKILLKQYQLQINKLIEENILLRAQLEQLNKRIKEGQYEVFKCNVNE